MGRTLSSSAPSVTRIAWSGWNADTTSSSCAAMARSERTPTFSSPVRIATSISSSSVLASTSLSLTERAPRMALVSLSSGSAMPSLSAAVRTFRRPTTGPRMEVFNPRSLSRSTVMTNVLVIRVHPRLVSPPRSFHSNLVKKRPEHCPQTACTERKRTASASSRPGSGSFQSGSPGRTSSVPRFTSSADS